MSGGVDSIWAGVDSLVDEAPTAHDLLVHRLHLFAARRCRALGREIPPLFARLEVREAAHVLSLAPLLERVRGACEGPMLVLKGPEIAARYPDPGLRPHSDLDILVPDAHAAQRALLAAGFFEVGEEWRYVDIHHLPPLAFGGLPIVVELHKEPKWVQSMTPPSVDDLYATAVPARLPIGGFLALPPAHHALVAAVHSWAHRPLRRILDLVDVAVLADEVVEPEALDELATLWGMRRLWQATNRALQATLLGGPLTLSMRIWARNVRLARDRTVLENHLQRWLAPWWELPPRSALRATLRSLSADLRPEPGETWGRKIHRTQRALAHASTSRRSHEHTLARELREHDRT